MKTCTFRARMLLSIVDRRRRRRALADARYYIGSDMTNAWHVRSRDDSTGWYQGLVTSDGFPSLNVRHFRLGCQVMVEV